jgi:hypothetical protein
MKTKYDERGEVNVLLVPVVLLTLMFLTAAGFGVWAFMGRQDYKNNSDAKVVAGQAETKKQTQAEDAKVYAEQAKQPLTTYVGPDSYGSVHVTYPKTWSAYVDTTNASTPLDAYFHTEYVPAVNSKSTYNLRVKVIGQSYSALMNQYASVVTSGKAKAAPYSLPKVPNVAGTQLTGQLFPSNQTASGVVILLPLRDKTLYISTESPSYLADFNTYILPNLTFSP